MLNLLSPTQHLASSAWFEFQPGIRFLIRRRGSRAHQGWLRKRRASNPAISQAAPIVFDLIANSDDREERLSEALQSGKLDLLAFLDQRSELDADEAAELIEDWAGIVDMETGAVEGYSPERASWFLAIEDLLRLEDGRQVPFGEHLAAWVLARSEELESFHTDREKSAEKNSEASSASCDGEASSKTTTPASSTAN